MTAAGPLLVKNPAVVAALKGDPNMLAQMDQLHADAGGEERRQILEVIRLHTEATGERPTGQFTGCALEHPYPPASC